jgi:nucleolar protein 16
LRKGFGRIIRDEAGNVIDVEMAEEDEEEHAGPAEDEIEDLDAEAEWKGLGAESDWVKAISHSENDADGGVVSGEHALRV